MIIDQRPMPNAQCYPTTVIYMASRYMASLVVGTANAMAPLLLQQIGGRKETSYRRLD